MDLITLALAKKYAKTLAGMVPEQIEQIIYQYLDENDKAIEIVKDHMNNYGGISIVNNVMFVDLPPAKNVK